MLASAKKSARSTVTSSKLSASTKHKESYWAFLWRKIREAFARTLLISRRFLWVSSTSTCQFSQA